jgi:hypothetical protein
MSFVRIRPSGAAIASEQPRVQNCQVICYPFLNGLCSVDRKAALAEILQQRGQFELRGVEDEINIFGKTRPTSKTNSNSANEGVGNAQVM